MSGVTLENLKRGIDAALGRKESCLALTNAKVVDVMNCEVIPGATVVIDGGRIAAVLRGGEAKSVNARAVFDCGGKYLIPGLMDVHVHIESTLLTPGAFAAAVLPCGTTRVVADPHEIANASLPCAICMTRPRACPFPSILPCLPVCPVRPSRTPALN